MNSYSVMGRHRKTLKSIPFLIVLLSILPSTIFFFLGHTRGAILSLGLIPLFVLCWEMHIILFSDEAKTLQRISNNLTETEHRQFRKLSGIYGAKCGALFGTTAAGVPLLLLKGVFGIEDLPYLIMGVIATLAVMCPFALRFQKPLIDFALSTEYAKEQGWCKPASHR
jgi:hypothetical protein